MNAALTRPANTPQKLKAHRRALEAQWARDLRVVRTLQNMQGKILRLGGRKIVISRKEDVMKQVARFV